MMKIVISDLRIPEVVTLIHDLSLVQSETVLGGILAEANYFRAGAGHLLITTVHDGINSVEDRIDGSYQYYFVDNKVRTKDYSRINNIYVW
ncbi:hypothetical protein VB735_33295 [Halotia wernerae UHCC 0503]|nr:hypothetical protein [Halotia wernerae UHCC 0503]